MKRLFCYHTKMGKFPIKHSDTDCTELCLCHLQFYNTAACTYQIPASLQLKQPFCLGQQYTTPHENEVSHSEHQAHCPVLTPPLTLTIYPVCVCVLMYAVLQTVLCSQFMYSQIDPILIEGGRKLHSSITPTEML